MRKIACFFASIILLSGQLVYAENIKVGFVEIQRVLNESDSGKKAKSELDSLVESKRSEKDAKDQAIQKLRNDLEKQSPTISEDLRKSKEEELMRLIREYQRIDSDSKNEVEKKERELIDKIIIEITTVPTFRL